MMILEMFQEIPAGYAADSEDNSSIELSDTRKTRLTLAQLNRIRMVSDVRKFEKEQELDSVSKQYAPAPSPDELSTPSGI